VLLLSGLKLICSTSVNVMATEASGSLKVTHVVTCFLLRNSRILLLKRSAMVDTFKGRWAAVSGFIESDDDSQSLIEIEEETSLLPADLNLKKKGAFLEVDDASNGVRWIVHPYLYEVMGDKPVRIDWEYDELLWIEPAELGRFETVPGLAEVLSRVYPV